MKVEHPCSKWEVLEYLRGHGDVRIKELIGFFGSCVCPVIQMLLRQHFAKKYFIRFHHSHQGLVREKEPAAPKDKRHGSYLGLTDGAYEYLRKNRVKSFLETPGAIISKQFYLVRDKKEWIKI